MILRVNMKMGQAVNIDRWLKFFKRNILVFVIIEVLIQQWTLPLHQPSKSYSLEPQVLPQISLGVGKSSLLIKYVKNIFSYEYQVTTGI